MRELIFLIAEFERCSDRVADFETESVDEWVMLSYDTKNSIEAQNS
jgi:hypothetical protein